MDFAQFKNQIFSTFRLDLNSYKETQLKRRIDSLMARQSFSDYRVFFNNLHSNRDNWLSFLDYLTINVSEFFRDLKMFQNLETQVLPELFKRKNSLKIWSAACSNGAEPYSLAILMEELNRGLRYTLEATDLDKNILAQAAKGSYPADTVRNVSRERLQKHFVQEGDRFNISETIKSRVTFRQHDLLMEAYGQGYDLIACRNVTIYFTREAQDKVNLKFSQSLNPGGYLFIGGSETIFNFAELGLEKLFPCFYRKK